MNSLLEQLSIFLAAALLVLGCEAPGDEVDEADFPRDLSTEYENIQLDRVVDGLEHPWSVDFLPDDRMIVTERPGRLNIVENGEVTEVSGLPEIESVNQGGLMEVSLHPDYEENGWIYLTYSKPNDNDETATALVRGQLDGTDLVEVEELFVQNIYSSPGRHYGSKLAWTQDGHLLMSIGDRGAEPPRAQDLDDHAGTLLRMNDDGSVPEDNPFADDPEALDEIYTYGNRNIQGLVVDPETDEIWSTEHGPRGGDELNLLEAGNNHGWPTVTLGWDYGTEDWFPDAEARRMEGMTEPIYEFLPTHAPSGLALVTSDEFPNWEGNLLAGGLRSERIRRVVVGEYEGAYEVFHEEELLLEEIGRIRDVREGPDGAIYVLTDHSDGGIYQITSAE